MALNSNFLARHFGPSFLGTRNWLLISALLLLVIVLLGGFALFPFSSAVFAAIIGLKIGVFISFVAGVGMGVKALIDDYVQKSTEDKAENETGSKKEGKKKNQADYYWLPYLQDICSCDFLKWIMKSPVNAAKFLLGLLLFAGVVTVLLCVCCPAIALAIPGVTAVVGFVSAAFEACSLFAGSWVFTAAFLGVVTMLAYDVLWRVGEVFSKDSLQKEDVSPNNGYSSEKNRKLSNDEFQESWDYGITLTGEEYSNDSKTQNHKDESITKDEADCLKL